MREKRQHLVNFFNNTPESHGISPDLKENPAFGVSLLFLYKSQPTIISIWYQVRLQDAKLDNKQAHKRHFTVLGVSSKCTFLTFNSSWLLYFLNTTKKINRITHWVNYMLNIKVKWLTVGTNFVHILLENVSLLYYPI